MSQLLTLEKPPNARTQRLSTPRGVFTALDVEHSASAPYQGIALLVPGFMGSKEDFLPLLPGLSRGGYRVVAIDGRGQYDTGRASSNHAYDKANLTRDLTAIVKHLNAGPVHLLGHSYGGLVARAAAIETAGDSSLWASLTLMNFGPGSVSAGQKERLRLLLDVLGSMTLEEIWPFVENQEADTAPSVRDFMRMRWLKNIPEHLVAAAEQMLNEPDLTTTLAEIRVAKAVISGSPDATWPPEAVEEMAHRLGAHITQLPGGGHSPNVHQPAEVTAALIDFWDRSPAR